MIKTAAELRAATRRAIREQLWGALGNETASVVKWSIIEAAIDAEIAAVRPFNQDALDLAGKAARAVLLNLRENGHGDVADHPDLASMIEQHCFNALQRFAAARPQWQDISMAPKDGRCVLLSAYGLSGASEPAFWHDGSENYWKREGWYAEEDRQSLLTAKPLLGFDLYMPLPEAPEPPR